MSWWMELRAKLGQISLTMASVPGNPVIAPAGGWSSVRQEPVIRLLNPDRSPRRSPVIEAAGDRSFRLSETRHSPCPPSFSLPVDEFQHRKTLRKAPLLVKGLQLRSGKEPDHRFVDAMLVQPAHQFPYKSRSYTLALVVGSHHHVLHIVIAGVIAYQQCTTD